nr:E3 ubiquitin-protein ligase RNF168-like isoform X1 [Procambarus clarkii]XP_045592783.1 E3 ubiquitin-protein ligase RNF168-like isoform X1 [Procambarus clarkii]
MENDNPEECKVCITNYDKAKRRPRTLPCGHTFCTLCVAGMIKLQRLSCPTCRVDHKATSATHFPISYDMEAVIRKLKVLQLTVLPSSKPNERRSLIQEKEDSVSQLLSGFQETLSQLKRYEVQLRDWKNQHEELLAKLSDLVERNKGALKLLEDELSILLYQRKKGEEGVARLEGTQGSLAGVHSAAEAATALDDSERYNAEVEDWIQNCQKIFPDVNTIHTSLKVREVTKRALETIKDADAIDDAPVFLGDADHTIMEKVDQLAPILSIESLRRLGETVKALIEADKVVAVPQDQGRQLSSRITLHKGRLHLHTLLHQPTPLHAHTLEHETLMNLVEPSSTLVFLDIGWAGSARGRIYIRLSPDTGLAKQFLLMCTGLRGPTYANTRILGVWNKGTEFEMVGGGDYDCNNGQGGTPLLQGLTNCEAYRRPARAGTVRALHGPESTKSAQFSITTRDCANREWYWAFGQVESGLDVLKAVANHKCIKEVSVVDCGVLLPP